MSEKEVMTLQNSESLTLTILGLPFGSPRTKRPFGCGSHKETQRILYGGRWWIPLNLGHDESYESRAARGLF